MDCPFELPLRAEQKNQADVFIYDANGEGIVSMWCAVSSLDKVMQQMNYITTACNSYPSLRQENEWLKQKMVSDASTAIDILRAALGQPDAGEE
ncbi:MAG: hypothetical protein ACYS6W_15035 [Planctomycetota bacterium]|jgi:hypothetical protein